MKHYSIVSRYESKSLLKGRLPGHSSQRSAALWARVKTDARVRLRSFAGIYWSSETEFDNKLNCSYTTNRIHTYECNKCSVHSILNAWTIPYGVRDYVDGIVAEYKFIWTMLFAVKQISYVQPFIMPKIVWRYAIKNLKLIEVEFIN